MKKQFIRAGKEPVSIKDMIVIYDPEIDVKSKGFILEDEKGKLFVVDVDPFYRYYVEVENG
jgi:hypothetical protein